VVGGFKVSSLIFQTQQFREFAIETNIGLKQPEGLEWNVSDLESFSVGKIWEKPARFWNCLSTCSALFLKEKLNFSATLVKPKI